MAQSIGAACLPLRADLPSPARVVNGPFDDAIAGPWRAIICGAHPFDTAAAARVLARRPGLPLLRFRRAAWQQNSALRWTPVTVVNDAVALIPAGGTVFAATGRESEPALKRYKGRVILRQNAAHNEPPAADNINFLFGTRSFDAATEEVLFRDLGVTHLLARNLGGSGGVGKLHAAARMGVPILMLERPAVAGLVVSSAPAVRAWLESTCA